MARKRKFTVVKTSPFGRPGDVISEDPADSRVAAYVEKGLLVEGEEEVEVPTPPATVAGDTDEETEAAPEPVTAPEPEEKPARKARAKKASD